MYPGGIAVRGRPPRLVNPAQIASPEAHSLLFGLSILAIISLAALLSRATEAVSVLTGDAVGGLLNATLGNLTELVISLAALQAGQYQLVKASLAGAIVTNTLFMLGGLKHLVQDFNRINARFQACLLFLATVAVLVPSLIKNVDQASAISSGLSLGLALLLIAVYGLGMLFSLKTHRELFASAGEAAEEHDSWPLCDLRAHLDPAPARCTNVKAKRLAPDQL